MNNLQVRFIRQPTGTVPGNNALTIGGYKGNAWDLQPRLEALGPALQPWPLAAVVRFTLVLVSTGQHVCSNPSVVTICDVGVDTNELQPQADWLMEDGYLNTSLLAASTAASYRLRADVFDPVNTDDVTPLLSVESLTFEIFLTGPPAVLEWRQVRPHTSCLWPQPSHSQNPATTASMHPVAPARLRLRDSSGRPIRTNGNIVV